MKILVYGAGALGQALGCMLAADGHEVDLILRERFIPVLQAKGLRVAGVFGEYGPVTTMGLLPDVSQATKSYDYALVTTKTYDTSQAVEDLGRIEERVAAIVSMQNGCGNVEQLVDRFGAGRVLGARVITGFEISEPGVVQITVSADAIHVGGSRSGEIPQSAMLLAEAISSAGHECLAVNDIHQSLYAKLLYNCSLNPLGAILGVHYGALTEREETRAIIDAVISETFAMIAAIGGSTPWQSAAEYRETFYSQLIPATYNHRASMLQDLENNKPTEVDGLVGYVSAMGAQHDVPTPTCDLLASLVRFKQVQPG